MYWRSAIATTAGHCRTTVAEGRKRNTDRPPPNERGVFAPLGDDDDCAASSGIGIR